MDWLAGGLELIACWLIGSRVRSAFLIGLAGNLAWVAYVLTTGSARGLLLVCVPMAVINIRNYHNWGTNAG